MAATYEKGTYQSGEGQISVRGKYATARTPVVIVCHGRTWNATEILLTSTLMVFCNMLSEHGYSVLSIDAGQGDTWGNSASETALGSAISWVKGPNGFADTTKKVVLLGHSMGGLVTLNYAKNNPSNVAGVIGAAPATNLERWHSDATYGASVDTAFGGNYAVNAVDRDPILYAASFPNIPTRIYSALDDTFIPTAEVLAFNNALPANNNKSVVTLPDGGHQNFFDRIDLAELLSWLGGLSY